MYNLLSKTKRAQEIFIQSSHLGTCPPIVYQLYYRRHILHSIFTAAKSHYIIQGSPLHIIFEKLCARLPLQEENEAKLYGRFGGKIPIITDLFEHRAVANLNRLWPYHDNRRTDSTPLYMAVFIGRRLLNTYVNATRRCVGSRVVV